MDEFKKPEGMDRFTSIQDMDWGKLGYIGDTLYLHAMELFERDYGFEILEDCQNYYKWRIKG